MPVFDYTTREPSGKAVLASLNAPTRRDALRILTARGIQASGLRESVAKPHTRGGSVREPDAPARNTRSDSKFTSAERLPFLQALVELIASGLPAGEAIRLLSTRLKAPRRRALCVELWTRLTEGQPLSQALASQPLVFDTRTISLIAAGEATGNLREVLQRLIQHFTEQREFRQKVVAALAYPVFICVVALGVILFFVLFLLPRLQTLLSSLGGKLPLATRALVGFSHLLVNYGLLAAVAVAVGGAFFWRWRRTEPGRIATDAWLLKVPWLRDFIMQTTVHGFSQTLAVLLENGITTAEALRMTERTITHHTLRCAFSEATDRVLEGERLSQALLRTNCFPDLVLDRLSIGESTGSIAPSLRDIAQTYQQSLSRQVQMFTTMLSSLVLFGAFSFVAFIAYAIVAAVFQVSASFKF